MLIWLARPSPREQPLSPCTPIQDLDKGEPCSFAGLASQPRTPAAGTFAAEQGNQIVGEKGKGVNERKDGAGRQVIASQAGSQTESSN